ncbi:alpha/beta hydrolase [Pedobacter sp. MC2016-24]|uniref:alpha/beta hydrolase n=1 Tax=Pedobacter sp. MC2016-24 TaxID=2780090 RepID=UPI00187EFE51|nr:alpha/beta hydrolase-fold protein [Pedobacter sp. MC2016-24]MBE9597976.1 alpha/beta hydrolase [Pedobacter sp. MC2016-24]
MKKNKYFLIVMLLVKSFWVVGQNSNSVSIGKIERMYSKVLGEERKFLVHLPSNYNPQVRYPVAYLLDGDVFFHFYTGISDFLTASSAMPEMIVIGICNTERSRDFTLPVDSSSNYKPNGAGEKFISFLDKELIPEIEKKYLTAPYRLLLGHSVGGLLVANVLVKYPSMFSSYIALDPSLWWKQSFLLKNISTYIKANTLSNKALYLAMANSINTGNSDILTIKKDTTDATVAMRSVIAFDEFISANQLKTQLQYVFKYYTAENHSSIPLIATYDALNFIFNFYKRPRFSKLSDSSALILENHYQYVSKKMGYQILPLKADIKGLAWRSKVLDKNFKIAKYFLEMYVRLYPDDQSGWIELANYYQEIGDKENSAKFKIKAERLNIMPN